MSTLKVILSCGFFFYLCVKILFYVIVNIFNAAYSNMHEVYIFRKELAFWLNLISMRQNINTNVWKANSHGSTNYLDTLKWKEKKNTITHSQWRKFSNKKQEEITAFHNFCHLAPKGGDKILLSFLGYSSLYMHGQQWHVNWPLLRFWPEFNLKFPFLNF